MELKLLDNNSVNFLGFYAYNHIKLTNINSDNSLVFADAQFGVSDKMLMSYKSKVYVVTLYHTSKTNNKPKEYIMSTSYLNMQSIEQLKKIDITNIDYLVIAERQEITKAEIRSLVENIIGITNRYNDTSYNIYTTSAKITYSSLDDVKINSKRVEFNFYKEVLGVSIDDTKPDEEEEEETNLNKKGKKKPMKLSWLFFNNNYFYNILSLIVVLATVGIVGTGVYQNGIKDSYLLAGVSILIALIFIMALQYIRIDNNKHNKK